VGKTVGVRCMSGGGIMREKFSCHSPLDGLRACVALPALDRRRPSRVTSLTPNIVQSQSAHFAPHSSYNDTNYWVGVVFTEP
jgi:hypothetical protein